MNLAYNTIFEPRKIDHLSLSQASLIGIQLVF